MGLSLSVIAALCFLLPGITFVLGFSRLHNPDSPPTALDEHVSVGLVAVLVVALIVQGFWFAGIDAIATLGGFSSPSAAQFVALLSGASVGNPAFPKALESLQEFPIRIALYFSAAAVGSWVIGRGSTSAFAGVTRRVGSTCSGPTGQTSRGSPLRLTWTGAASCSQA